MDIKITGIDDVLKRLDNISNAASPAQNARLWSSMRCPTHHRAPANIRVVGSEVTADFCCKAFGSSAAAATEKAIQDATR